MKKSFFITFQFSEYRTYFFGSTFGFLAIEMMTVIFTWQLYTLTNSPLSLGFIGLARFLPISVFSLVGGVVADSVDRRKLIIIAEAIVTCISLLFGLFSLNNHITPLLIYCLIVILSAVDSFHIPARQAVMPALVPKKYFSNAVSLNSTTWQGMRIIGPAVAGFLIAVLPISTIYFFVSGLFSIMLFTRLYLKSIPTENKQKSQINLKYFFEGIHFVRKNPLIYSTMILDFIATFFSASTTLLPIFAKDILKVGPQGLGILYSSASIGSVIAGIFFSIISHTKYQGRILLGSVLLYGLATISFGLSRSFWVSTVCLALTGAGDMISTIIRNAIRQLVTPDHLRGRMVSVNMLFFLGGPQLGEVEAGTLASAIGTPLSVVIGGIGTVLATLVIAYAVPMLRNYHSIEEHEHA